MSQQTITLEDINLIDFFGVNNRKLALLRKAFPETKISTRGNTIKVSGSEEDVESVCKKIDLLVDILHKYEKLSDQNIADVLFDDDSFRNNMENGKEETILFGIDKKPIKPRSENQKKLVKLSDKNDITFAIGPAGTGKTYTAVALAVKALKNKEVKKIILTRPAVEAGENLGFLPGDLKEKVDPYLRPLYDALYDMIPSEKLNKYIEDHTIEVAPLAFMRGRTLDNAFIILDEAQNATHMQLKMFLTRIGPIAKVIITGDLTQIDLPKVSDSGLGKVLTLLNDIKGIAMVYLDTKDVVRHRLVKAIINAYKTDKENAE